jgi:hypothetical protein
MKDYRSTYHLLNSGPALLIVLFSAVHLTGISQNLSYQNSGTSLNPGRHNTTPITGCIGYNPAELVFEKAPSGGLPPYYYQWQLNDLAIPGETKAFYDPPQLTLSGTYRYNCRIRDQDGTQVYTEYKLITVVPDPSVTIEGGGFYCMNTGLLLTAVVTGGTGFFSFQWQSSADNILFTIISGANDQDYPPELTLAGTLYYRVRVYPNTGSCNDAISPPVSVTVIPIPCTSAIYHL